MNKFEVASGNLLFKRSLSFPNLQISPAKNQSLVDIASYASLRFAFLGRNLNVWRSYYY